MPSRQSDNHITVNNVPLAVVVEEEKKEEIEELRQSEIADVSRRMSIRTGRPLKHVSQRNIEAREKMERAKIAIAGILASAPDGMLFRDVAAHFPSFSAPMFSLLTTEMGCIKWQAPDNDPVTNRRPHLIRLRRDDDPPPGPRIPRHRRTKVEMAIARGEIQAQAPLAESPSNGSGNGHDAATLSLNEAFPRELPPVPMLPRAPARLKPMVGSLRAELVEFATAMRVLERRRMKKLSKLAKLDARRSALLDDAFKLELVHARNWRRLIDRLTLAEPDSAG